jgi:hypothetical protein
MGMIDSSQVQSLLKFLDIQRKLWQIVIEQTALASVRAFHFLHKVPFSEPLELVQLDTDPNRAGEDDASTTVTKRKYETTSKHFVEDDSDSDSHEHEHIRLQKEARQLRKPRHTYPPNPVLAVAEPEPLAPALLTRRTPNPVYNRKPE